MTWCSTIEGTGVCIEVDGKNKTEALRRARAILKQIRRRGKLTQVSA